MIKIIEKRLDIFRRSKRYKYLKKFDLFYRMYEKVASVLTPDDFDYAVKLAYDQYEHDYFDCMKQTDDCFDKLDQTLNQLIERTLDEMKKEKENKLARLAKKYPIT